MNIAVAQSGGPTAAINASLLGVIKEAYEIPSINRVYGSYNGIEGIIKDQLINLNSTVATKEDFDLLY